MDSGFHQMLYHSLSVGIEVETGRLYFPFKIGKFPLCLYWLSLALRGTNLRRESINICGSLGGFQGTLRWTKSGRKDVDRKTVLSNFVIRVPAVSRLGLDG